MVQVTAGGQVTDNSGVSTASGSNASQTAGNVQASAAEGKPLGTPEEIAAAATEEASKAPGESGTTEDAPKAPAEGDTTEEAPKERPEGVSPDAPEGFVPFAGTDDELKANLKAAGGLYADARYEPAAIEFKPGQFISFEMPHPESGRLVTRAYSIASSPSRSGVVTLLFNRVSGGPGSTLLYGFK